MFTLFVLSGPDRGRCWPLPPGEPQLLGRSTEALPLTDPSVSRRHAELTPADGQWMLRDLDSTNGTRLNGEPVRERSPIAPGDRIRLGDTLLEVRDGGTGPPSPSAAMPDADLAAAGAAVASLSHSIKNILQAMRGGADAVELAIDRGDLEMARRGWPILARNLDRIHALSLNLLAIAHDRAIDAEPALLPPLLQEVAELLRPSASRRGVRIEVACDPDLPETSIDLGGIHQAIMNLATNAIEAAAPRRGVVVLEARRAANAGGVVLAVSDDGDGVPEAVRPRLFEAFVSTKGQRGSGLGLAVSRRIVERHGGRIWLDESRPGRTRFAFELPAEPPEDSGRTRGPMPIPPEAIGYEFD